MPTPTPVPGIPTTPAPTGSGYPGQVAQVQGWCAKNQQMCPLYYMVVDDFREKCKNPMRSGDGDLKPICDWLATANEPAKLQAAVATPCGNSQIAMKKGVTSLLGTSQFAQLQDTGAWQTYERALVNVGQCGAK